MASANKTLNPASATVWLRCSICYGWFPSISSLKEHGEKSHGKMKIVLPKNLHPEHEDNKIYSTYDTPYHQDPLPPPLPLSLLKTTSYYYPNMKPDAEVTENCSKSSQQYISGNVPTRIGDVSGLAVLSETVTENLSECQNSDEHSACEPQASLPNNNKNKFQCKQCTQIFQNMQLLILHMKNCRLQTDSNTEKVVININTDNTGNLQSWIAGGGSADPGNSKTTYISGNSSILRSILQSKLSADYGKISEDLPQQENPAIKKPTSVICQMRTTRRRSRQIVNNELNR